MQISLMPWLTVLDWRELGALIEAGKRAGKPVALSSAVCLIDLCFGTLTGLDWRELGALIEAEKRAGNPVAALVGKLALERNSATLLLRNTLDEEVDSDEEDAPPPQPTPVS